MNGNRGENNGAADGIEYVGGLPFARIGGVLRALTPEIMRLLAARRRAPSADARATDAQARPSLVEITRWRFWRASKTSKIIHILIRCPECGMEQILGHLVCADGEVKPSVVCHNAEGKAKKEGRCGFHRYCKLARWDYGTYPPRDVNDGLL